MAEESKPPFDSNLISLLQNILSCLFKGAHFYCCLNDFIFDTEFISRDIN